MINTLKDIQWFGENWNKIVKFFKPLFERIKSVVALLILASPIIIFYEAKTHEITKMYKKWDERVKSLDDIPSLKRQNEEYLLGQEEDEIRDRRTNEKIEKIIEHQKRFEIETRNNFILTKKYWDKGLEEMRDIWKFRDHSKENIIQDTNLVFR